MTDNQESFIIESSQNMKKNDKESFIGTGQNLKDEESSITTDITDALEMDMSIFVIFFIFFIFLFFIFFRLSKIGNPYLVMVLMAIIIPLCCCFYNARCYNKRTATITEPND